MSLFILGLMPTFIILQLFMGRSIKLIFWHSGVGILMALPFIAIRALLLDQGFTSDHVTFLSEWGVSFILDYLLPLGYLAVVIPLSFRGQILIMDEIFILTSLASFFMIDNFVFVLFKNSADGSYEYLFRPLFYLILTLLQAKMYTKFSWVVLVLVVLISILGSVVDVFIFMNQNLFAGGGIALLVILAMGYWLFLQFFHAAQEEQEAEVS